MSMKSSQANRGMSFESLVEHANAQYARQGIAHIQKIATPWKVLRGAQGKIVNAFPEKKSTVDFIGMTNGEAIALDAKSTKIKTSFPLANIEQHQIDFMWNWRQQGGTAFILVEFAAIREIYRLNIPELRAWWHEAQTAGGRKSIPHQYFLLNCQRVDQGRGIVLDYLAPWVSE